MEVYHYKWLEYHPNRTREWLSDRLKEGFDIHHIDGDKNNNEPDNIVLIDHADHIMLHTGVRPGKTIRYLRNRTTKGTPRKIKRRILTVLECKKYQEELAKSINKQDV